MLARSGDHFADFRPYVASIDDRGVVAFQAGLAGGGTGVFVADEGGARPLAVSDATVRAFASHPDRDGDGATSVYAELAGGVAALVVVRDGRAMSLVEGGVGPLGPTMNARGEIAYRATTRAGHQAIFVVSASGGAPVLVAESGARFAGFEGLPVVTEAGAVVFRADLAAGGQGIFRHQRGALVTVVETGDELAELGRFPSAAGDGTVVFVASRPGGGGAVLRARGDERTTVVDAGAGFESFRGALVNDRGDLVFYATPPGGTLGIYRGPDPAADRLLAIGDPLLGSTISAFALNPVSMNRAAQLAVRVELASGGQAIVRLDSQ